MGDGLPSFAPQWLKSGSSATLGAGTHSSSSTATREEASRSWRESGSRLGWGAGTAERESEAKPAASTTRRQGSSFQERSRNYGADRNSFRPGNGRVLSDRELVEQTTSLKLRPPLRSPDPGFLDEPFLPPPKNGERSFAGRGQGSSRSTTRKPGSSSRSTPIHPQTPEREFSALSRPAAPPAHTWLAGGASPRAAPSEQPWTSRLADRPAEAAGKPGEGPQDAAPSSPGVPQPSEAVPKPAPRMADAILQAQASAGQEADAAKAARLRMEQLALRTSKQLMPVMPGAKSKAAAPTSLQPPPSLTPLKKPLGMEPLGRVAQPAAPSAAAARKEESGPKRSAPPAAGGFKAADPTRERDRAAFFGSLRRKTSGGDPGQLTRQGSGVASNGSVSPQSQSQAEAAAVGLPVAQTNGKKEVVRVDMTPEEVAFMRSLGWEEEADDADDGLTEEEVAAFLKEHQNKLSRSEAPNAAGSAAKRPSSYNSELEFSDSGNEQ